MKNLKRALSLALATVMVIGMMVVGASAAFNDQADIDYAEAVDMLVGLGVIDGMGNNTFAPDGTLTRAQAAKMVAYVKAGANENTVGYYDGETKFSDVGTNHNWAKGSINYCVANGIIAGMTATTYQPDAQLTGAQLAKMLLVALGYPATSEKDTETLTGPNWQNNTLRKATEAGLFKGLNSDFVAIKAVTRQEACQMIYNALNAYTVKVGSWDMYGNPNYVVSDVDLLTACFDVVKLTGVVYGNAATGEKGTLVDVTTKDGEGTAYGTMTFELETGIDLLGHNVTVLARTDNTGLVLNKETSAVLTYGCVDNASLAKTVVATKDGLEKDAKAAGFKVDGTPDNMYENYAGLENTASKDLTYTEGGSYVLIANNETKTLTTVIKTSSALDQLKSITTTGTGDKAKTTYAFEGGQANLENTATTTKVNVYDGAAAGDYVILTAVDEITNMAKATTVTTTVTALNKDGSKLTGVVAGGTTYAKSGVNYTDSKISGVRDFTNAALGEGVLILDGEGKLIAQTGVAATTNYAYVAAVTEGQGTGADGMFGDVTKALVYFADGTSGVYTVDTKAEGSATVTADLEAGIYDVALTNDTVVIKDNTLTETTVESVTAGLSKVGDAYTDNSTVVFAVSGSYDDGDLKVTVYTGTANIPTMTKGDGSFKAYEKKDSDPAVVQVMLADNVTLPTSDTTVYYYNGVYALGNRTENGKTIATITYTVYENGVATTMTFDKQSSPASETLAKGFVKLNAKGNDLEKAVEKDKVTEVISGAVDYFNGTLTISTKPYIVNSDTKVVCLLADGSSYTLEQLATDTLVDSADIAVAYTSNADDSVRTATIIYVTYVDLAE